MLIERAVAQRQRQRSTVNFGVVATARAVVDDSSKLLDLHCEYGSADCSTILAVSRDQYEQSMTCHTYLLVASAHLPVDPSQVITQNDCYAFVEISARDR